LDDTVATSHSSSAAAGGDADKVSSQRSTPNVADDVASSTPQRRRNDGTGISPLQITIHNANDADGENSPEKAEPPSSPQDASGQRSSMFSKRAGVTPMTPPAKEARGTKKMTSPAHEERRKSKGCCVIF